MVARRSASVAREREGMGRGRYGREGRKEERRGKGGKREGKREGKKKERRGRGGRGRGEGKVRRRKRSITSHMHHYSTRQDNLFMVINITKAKSVYCL